jgi:hypothetical protein
MKTAPMWGGQSCQPPAIGRRSESEYGPESRLNNGTEAFRAA